MDGAKEPTPFGWWLLHQMAGHEPRLSQTDVARLAGVGQSTISRWIYDPDIKPETGRLGRLAEVLGVSKNELLQRAGHGTADTSITVDAGPVLTPNLAEAQRMLDPSSPLTADERHMLDQGIAALVGAYRHAMRRRKRVS